MFSIVLGDVVMWMLSPHLYDTFAVRKSKRFAPHFVNLTKAKTHMSQKFSTFVLYTRFGPAD